MLRTITQKLQLSLSTTSSKVKAKIKQESFTIVDPYFYQSTDFLTKIQHTLANRSTFNDMKRSFQDFNLKSSPKKFLYIYNNVVTAVEKGNLQYLERNLSPTLFTYYQRTLKKKEEPRYHLPKADTCQLMQARTYSQNLTLIKSTEKWFQLILRYKLTNGEVAHHLLERNQKAKTFKFMKFYL